METPVIRSAVVDLKSELRALDCCGEAMLRHPPADSTCSTGAETRRQTPSCWEGPRARSPCYRCQAELHSDRILGTTAGESLAPPTVLGYWKEREVPRRKVPLLRQPRKSAGE